MIDVTTTIGGNGLPMVIDIKSSTFHELVSQLIARLYPRAAQNTSRIILNAYFSQPPDRRRRLTLEALGETAGLARIVSRERARQILEKFFKKDLPKEITRLERGKEIDDTIMVSNRKDLLRLRNIICAIVAEIETFDFPIFVDRIQARLKRLGLVDEKIFFPVVVELAQSFSLIMSFDISDHEGRRVVLEKGDKVKQFTSEIIIYAGKISTHLGGVCSVDALIDTGWNPNSPESLTRIPESIRKKFVIDLLETVKDVMLLQEKSYFSFKDRDERVSSILLPIFKVYKSVARDRLFGAVTSGLKHRFMTKTKDQKREVELQIVMGSQLALDEYCRRTLILDVGPNDERVPGKNLKSKLQDYTPGESYQAQIDMASEIKRKGRPVTSVEFGEIYRNVLRVKSSSKGHFYSYPTLFYKEGRGRMNDYYKTLDGIYELSELTDPEVKKGHDSETLASLCKKILELQEKMLSLDFEMIPSGQLRVEQRLLREFLVENSSGVEMTSGDMSCRCLLCNRYFPAELLVAAHVKKRSHCLPEEKLDIENVAMLQCGSCDKLFERGFVYLNDDGRVVANDDAQMTEDVLHELNNLHGNVCEYVNGVDSRMIYIAYHREQALVRHKQG